MNSLYQQTPIQQNPMMNFMQRFQQFQKTFNGDPQKQIQEMMNSGKISQNQYNQAYQMAQQFMNMFGKK